MTTHGEEGSGVQRLARRATGAHELEQTAAFLEHLIDSTVDAIVASDEHGQIVLFNKAAQAMFGWRARDVIGRMAFAQLFMPALMEQLTQRLRDDQQGAAGRLEMVRSEIISARAERIPVQLSASVISREGRRAGIVATISDLRDRLRIERDLFQAQERLVETEKQGLIAELAGTAAHELNQPLTSVMGYAELLKKRMPSDDPNYQAVELIYEQAQRMADIVRKIGRITHYETKTYVGQTQILDLDKSSR